MKFLLDTNICSAHMTRPGQLAHRLVQYGDQLAIASIVLAELYTGAYHNSNPPRLLGLISDLLQDVVVLDFDAVCAQQFGSIRGQLLRRGISVNSMDLMIASVALVNDLVLVTHNTADFEQIPDLQLVDWLKR